MFQSKIQEITESLCVPTPGLSLSLTCNTVLDIQVDDSINVTTDTIHNDTTIPIARVNIT